MRWTILLMATDPAILVSRNRRLIVFDVLTRDDKTVNISVRARNLRKFLIAGGGRISGDTCQVCICNCNGLGEHMF